MIKFRIALFLIIPTLVTLGFGWLASAEKPPEPRGSAILEPALAKALASASPDDLLSVIVVLKEQELPEKWAGARDRMVANLKAFAARTQAPLKAYLDEARTSGFVESYFSFWIFNGFALKAKPQAIRQLASHPSVAAIFLDHYRQWLREKPFISLQSTEWNIERIRAPQVWSSLAISGTGAVVAVMDTGADWLHPALRFNYRGYNPHGPAIHFGNWFDPVTGSVYPFDDHGHGTHVLGIAVGWGGIGVAPGARWIAVKVLDGNGFGYDSWIHAGFQWLLAPGGNPALAPDVVNCSWGTPSAMSTVFQADIRALRAAGIVPVFAAGNGGPSPGSINSPASLPEAVAVGASDPYDQVASFSSRGPSPWNEIRPHVVAPGVNIRSSLPGGTYGYQSGTSMAAPHVTGLIALMRSVSPTLSVTRTLFLITSTAVPLTLTIPNNDSGWGRIDAFAAVAVVLNAGSIQGTVRNVGGAPIPGATVSATPRDGPGGGNTIADPSGRYALFLAPGLYRLTASAFGYYSQTFPNVAVSRGATTTVNFTLQSLPTGTLEVYVYEAATGRPLTAAISIAGTPLSATASFWSFSLPAGDYTVLARALGFRVATTTVSVKVGETTTVTLNLVSAPSILLVDSGAWYYGSQIVYYRQALEDLAYTYDEWTIRRIPRDLPAAEFLSRYDLVIWSAPQDAPGYIGAEGAITSYLSSGGRLFLSGQDIGFLDGGGIGYAPYYNRYLKARFVRDNSQLWSLQGLPGGPFAGLNFSIANGDGADNQLFPDVIEPADPVEASPVLVYSGDGYGGLAVGVCLDYRVLYFSFGFEAIASRDSRREIMDKAISWLTSPPPQAGLQVIGASRTIIGQPGDVITHGVAFRNIGRGGIDTITVSIEGGRWSAVPSAWSVTLEPCAADKIEIAVAIPPDAGWNEQDTLTLTLRSSLSSAVSVQISMTTKTPAPILLVDNDRWYEQAEKYESAMTKAGLPYDLLVATDSKLPLEMLNWYPIVVWWTGYNWYDPVRPEEEEALAYYLLNGGRLFLSSQDFLFCRSPAGLPFCRGTGSLLPFLGVLTWTEDITPTLALGVPEEPVGENLGPWPLEYPFRNWSDALEPTPGTLVVFRDQERRAIGLARRDGDRASVFFAFPFEALPEEARPQTMERIVGFLSWLGSSSFSAEPVSVMPGDTVTWTIVLRNDGPEPVTAFFSTVIPSGLTFLPSSLTGPAVYDPASFSISGFRQILPGESVIVVYRTAVGEDLLPGTVVRQEATMGIEEQGIRFRREARVGIEIPDLSPSTFGCAPLETLSGFSVSCVLTLRNEGFGDAPEVLAFITFPADSKLIADSVSWDAGDLEVGEGSLRWRGSLPAGSSSSVRWELEMRNWKERTFYLVALFGERGGNFLERAAWVKVRSWKIFFPLIFKSSR
ncbi:MAG: S8 family serine peptidase [Anaerolineae bacterium]|nr:S8 family serine peptidase [Anaerolineae bacterium]